MRALLLLLLPLSCSGCGAIEAVWKADFEPVVVPALWESGGHAGGEARYVAGPALVGLERAARTGEGVWHVELRYADGSLRRRIWDPGHPGLHGGHMDGWLSPDWSSASFVPTALPWPDGALPLRVLTTPGASLLGFVGPLPPDPAPGTPEEAVARELFAGLDEPWGEGDESLVRLSADRQWIEVAVEEEWRQLGLVPDLGRWLRAPERRRPVGSRVAEGTIKALLTPPALALDAGYLSVLGTAKVTTAILGAPLVILILTCGRGGC